MKFHWPYCIVWPDPSTEATITPFDKYPDVEGFDHAKLHSYTSCLTVCLSGAYA